MKVQALGKPSLWHSRREGTKPSLTERLRSASQSKGKIQRVLLRLVQNTKDSLYKFHAELVSIMDLENEKKKLITIFQSRNPNSAK